MEIICRDVSYIILLPASGGKLGGPSAGHVASMGQVRDAATAVYRHFIIAVYTHTSCAMFFRFYVLITHVVTPVLPQCFAIPFLVRAI